MRLIAPRSICAAILAASLAPAIAAPKVEPAPAAQAPALSPAKEGDRILRAMSAKLAAAKSFGFTATREIDASLVEGTSVPEKARVTVVVERPNRLAAQAMSVTGSRRFFFDGKDVTVLDVQRNHYATVPLRTEVSNESAGLSSVDALVERLDAVYGFTPPLAEFAVSNPYAEFRRHARTVTYLGRARTLGGFFGAGGVECHRLELKGKEADAELWVGVADNLPRKLVATFHREGKPQLRVDFVKWNLAPKLTSAEFAFTPPPGAQKIEMWTTAKMKSARKP
jgi:hypothetical protein